MFYKLIENKRDEWLKSEDCTVRDLLTYIAQRGFLRDAQFEAIKTYLYLKIACDNKPLWQLFTEGAFNSLDISQLELNETARGILSTNAAAVALLEYSRLKDKSGNQLAPGLQTFIKQKVIFFVISIVRLKFSTFAGTLQIAVFTLTVVPVKVYKILITRLCRGTIQMFKQIGIAVGTGFLTVTAYIWRTVIL